MADDLQSINAVTGVAPASRVLDATSLNAIVSKLISGDSESAKYRQNVQLMLDGAPPLDEFAMKASGQEGRCNLNFGDGKARVKSECAGYYDLTDSVPVLAHVLTDYDGGDPAQRIEWEMIMSEEFTRMLKEWNQFDMSHQLLVQKFVSHGLGFIYFKDDIDWRWEVAGLEDFKLPRGIKLSEDEAYVAAALRDVNVSTLWEWIKDVEAGDTRWNLKEVRAAILNASSGTTYSDGEWEKFQQTLKNNDIFASVSSREVVKLAHVWVREFSGKVSQYLTLRDSSNKDFLFKVAGRFDSTSECFTFFPYEVGSNGTLHSVRGLAHEIYPQVQVLNTLRCQTVDNAKLAGSLLLQPKTETDAEDMAIMFYAGAAYIPPNVSVQNQPLSNPSTSMLPVIQDMTLSLRRNSGDVPTNAPEGQRDKTKFQVQSELAKESVLPTANMNLFYQPWKRHLNEVWRRVKRKGVTEKDPGGEGILAFRKRCKTRLVPDEAVTKAYGVEPFRAMGYGSPSSRLLAMDEFMQYYGSLDPIGQNNLLRDRFAQKVGYAQVDRYVPRLQQSGRQPVDVEIAELQNMAMSSGNPISVQPNDQHILHVQIHNPSLENDLKALESGQGSPELLKAAQTKGQHVSDHMNLIKPDKLQKDIVAELTRQFNNLAQRVQAATEHAQIEAAQNPEPGQPDPKVQRETEMHELKKQFKIEDHQLELQLKAQSGDQKRTQADADAAARLRAQAARERFSNIPVAVPSEPAVAA